MKYLILASFLVFQCGDCVFSQSAEIRDLCKEAQGLELSLSKLTSSVRELNRKEKMSLPSMITVYEILSRYCTVLASLQRFSDMLIISKYQNKSDFIRCSIVIKSFADYFKTISLKLGKENTEMVKLQREKKEIG